MTLSHEDMELFYDIWMGLVVYVNNKYNITDDVKTYTVGDAVNSDSVKVIAETIWSKPEVIDDYLNANDNLSAEYRDIVTSWKRFKRNKFILYKHLTRGSIFLANNSAYLVRGICSSFAEVTGYRPVPMMVETTILPFKNVIIYDSILNCYNIFFGSGIKKSLKEEYSAARKEGRYFKTL